MKYICNTGYYCDPNNVVEGDISTVLTLCPEGFYCPNGTALDWKACPAGTYSSVTGLAKADDCTPCDAGKYCQGNNVCVCSIFFYV